MVRLDWYTRLTENSCSLDRMSEFSRKAKRHLRFEVEVVSCTLRLAVNHSRIHLTVMKSQIWPFLK
jgi:hypothetical protein